MVNVDFACSDSIVESICTLILKVMGMKESERRSFTTTMVMTMIGFCARNSQVLIRNVEGKLYCTIDDIV